MFRVRVFRRISEISLEAFFMTSTSRRFTHLSLSRTPVNNEPPQQMLITSDSKQIWLGKSW